MALRNKEIAVIKAKVLKILADPEQSYLTNERIAERFGISKNTVNTWRTQFNKERQRAYDSNK